MRLTTRSVRNISFAVMLAVLPLLHPVPLFAEFCGPGWCGSICPSQGGGYIAYNGCDPGTCFGSECTVGGDNCQEVCLWCPGMELEWLCD